MTKLCNALTDRIIALEKLTETLVTITELLESRIVEL